MDTSKKTKSDGSRVELIITCVITMIGAIVVGVIGAPDKWLAAIFCTVVTFAGMISYFRKSWSSKRFWMVMGSAFTLHLLLMWSIFGVILRHQEDVGLFICVPGILLECFVLYHAVRFFKGSLKEGQP